MNISFDFIPTGQISTETKTSNCFDNVDRSISDEIRIISSWIIRRV